MVTLLWPAAALSETFTIPTAPVLVDEEQGFKTIKLTIARSQVIKASDGTEALLIWFGGTWSGRRVGLGMAVSFDWHEPAQKSPFPVWLTNASATRTGIESDAFAGEFAKLLLGHPAPKPSLKKDIYFTAVNLGNKPAASSKRFELKLFPDAASQADYCELYVHIRLDESVVEFSEKDPQYRAALVRAFVVPQ